MGMKVMRKETAPHFSRTDRITSYLLASPLTCDSEHLTTTLVEVGPGGEQRIHSHYPEQVYYILSGGGMMKVGEDRLRVEAGTCVYIPPSVPHGIKNDGREVLVYLSAAAPSFEVEDLQALWPPIEEEGRVEL